MMSLSKRNKNINKLPIPKIKANSKQKIAISSNWQTTLIIVKWFHGEIVDVIIEAFKLCLTLGFFFPCYS